ncbi:MAG: NAD-dependent epimerase/dehydratase family protein [Isosphaeraceae bacterium]
MNTARGPQTPQVSLVTGATGLLGSHIAERLANRGDRVLALVRPSSDIRFLNSIGVEHVVGDLRDPEACIRAVTGVDRVYHSAAKVGDWGTWAEFRAEVVEATERLALASIGAGVSRFVQISSTSALWPPARGQSADRRIGSAGRGPLADLGRLHPGQG